MMFSLDNVESSAVYFTLLEKYIPPFSFMTKLDLSRGKDAGSVKMYLTLFLTEALAYNTKKKIMLHIIFRI